MFGMVNPEILRNPTIKPKEVHDEKLNRLH